MQFSLGRHTPNSGTLIFQYVLFGLIGVRAFGGLIYNNNPALAGTDYANREYFPNNFNDLPTACVVLFDLMVVNNWYTPPLLYFIVVALLLLFLR